MVERSVTIEQGTHQPIFLPIGILDAAFLYNGLETTVLEDAVWQIRGPSNNFFAVDFFEQFNTGLVYSVPGKNWGSSSASPCWTRSWGPFSQYISNKRPSRFVILNRLRLTRKTSYLKCIEPCSPPGRSVVSHLPRRYAISNSGKVSLSQERAGH